MLYVANARGKNTYPVVEYNTADDIVTSTGNWNLPYYTGDTVAIRYNPDNLTNFKIDTPWYCWRDLLMYSWALFLLYTFIFLGKDLIPKTISIKIGKRNESCP